LLNEHFEESFKKQTYLKLGTGLPITLLKAHTKTGILKEINNYKNFDLTLQENFQI